MYVFLGCDNGVQKLYIRQILTKLLLLNIYENY
jgi:hypothetical protein